MYHSGNLQDNDTRLGRFVEVIDDSELKKFKQPSVDEIFKEVKFVEEELSKELYKLQEQVCMKMFLNVDKVYLSSIKE